MKRTFTILAIASLLIVLGSISYGSFTSNTTSNTVSQDFQSTFSGSSQNYTLVYGTLGLGKSQGTSANYTLESTMPNQPTGQYNSTNYSLYLGPYYTQTLTHNIAVTNITISKTIIGQGYITTINITTKNKGIWTETFNITTKANNILIETKAITLTKGNSTAITFTWNTIGFAKGNYTINAVAGPIPSEIATADNKLTDGWVVVAMVGDISSDTLGVPDGKVDMVDMWEVAKRFGLNYPDPRFVANFDVDGDLKIDMVDMWIVAREFGKIDP